MVVAMASSRHSAPNTTWTASVANGLWKPMLPRSPEIDPSATFCVIEAWAMPGACR